MVPLNDWKLDFISSEKASTHPQHGVIRMRKNVLVLVFVVSLFGFGLIMPTHNAELTNPQVSESPTETTFRPSGIGDNTEDYVDQISNLYAPSDIGTHSIFAEMQDIDGTYDTLTEGDTGGAGLSEYVFIDTYSDVNWDETGVSPYLDTQDQPTSIISTATTGAATGWCGFAATSGSGSGFTVNFSIYHNSALDSFIGWELDWTGDTIADASGSFSTDYIYAWESAGTIAGLDTQAEIDACTVRFTHNKGGAGPDLLQIDAARLGISQAGSSVYDLDLEVGWTAADFDETNEELCIYGGTQGSEALRVDVWNGSWTNVITDLAAGWNNISVSSYLTDATFEIRFTDTSDDAVEADTWQVEGVLLHTWTPSYTPANDQAPTLDNPSDTDNMYAQYLEYQVTVYVSDQNGFADIDFLEIGLWDNTQTTEYCRFRYDEDTNAFSEEYDAGTYVTLNTGSSTATESGNDIDATFYFTIDWDFPDSTDLDANCTVIDTQTESATTWYEVNWDVETRLDYSVLPSVNDASGTADRGNLDSSFSLSGTVIYYTSVDDFPSSAAVDVWVSAPEYGTSAGPWSDLTLTSGVFDVTCYADDVVGQDTYTIKIVEEGAGSGGTDLYYTTSATDTYIADRVQVQSYSVADNRVDIGASVNVDFTLYYDYDDSPVTDGSVALNAISATHQGAGTWNITDSEATVMANTYNTVTYSGGTHGISIVDQNGLSQQVIWDQIVVQTTLADYTRVSTGANVEIRVTLLLAYDSTFLGSGDTVTLAGQAMTWDAGNSWFNLTVSQASVGLWTYFVNSSSQTSYGITTLDTNSQNVGVIWDQIVVQTTTADDTRVNVGDNVEIRVTLWLAYDSTFLGSGDTVTLAGQAMTWDAGNSWFDLTVSQVSVGLWTYFVNSSSEATYGVTLLDTNSQSVSVIWDQIVIQTTVADDTRVSVGDNVEVRVTLWLAYDSTYLGSGDTVTLAGQVMTWDVGNLWFDVAVTKASVGLWTYFVNSSTETNYGITLLDTNSQDVDIIWDQIIVQTTVADDTRVNVGDNVEIRVTLWLAYDSTFLGNSDTVTLAGQAMTWDAGNSWFDLTVFQISIGSWNYFVTASSQTSYGITALDTNSQSVSVIWDQIVVQTTVADDTRVSVGDNVEVRVTLWLSYDSTFLGSGDTVTLAGQLMTWDSVNSWFDLLVSKATVGLWSYFVNSSSDSTYGVTLLDTNSQSVDVVWDQIVVQTTVADDTRVNIGDNVEIQVTLWLAYDSTYLGSGDTVTLAGQAMTWDAGNSWFDLSVSQVSVGLWSYYVNSTSETAFGITDFSLNTQSVDVIWDQIVVQTTVADDIRINVGDTAEIRVTLWLAYDNTFLGSGDTVTLAGQAMTWDAGNSWFDLSVSQVSVGLWSYYVNSTSETAFGITDFSLNTQRVDVVWDRIIVQTTVADDNRVNVGDNVEIRVTLWLAYDSSFLGSGDTVTLAGQSMTWDASNLWFDLIVSQASVGLWTYFVNSSSDATFGITLFDTNSQSVDVIWDQIVVQTTTADDTRTNVGDNVEIRVTLWLAYDSSFLGSGDIVTLAGQAMTWDAGNSWFDVAVSKASVGLWTHFVNSSTETNYGITLLNTNSQSIDVIWDQIVVQTTIADDTRVNVGANVEIRATLWLAYDSTFLGSGDTVTLAGQVMTWDGVNSWFDLSVSQVSVGLWNYYVNLSSQTSFGITALNTNGQSVDVIWDQIVVQTTIADDARTNIGANVELRVTLWLAYDSTFLGSGDTVTLAGQAMTWDGVNSWFDLLVSQASVGLWNYYVNSSSDATYGITLLDTNSQSVSVIWDQITVRGYSVLDNRVNINDNVDINVTVEYEYDDTPVTDGTLTINSISATHLSSGIWQITVSESTVLQNIYNTVACASNLHGISSVNQDSQTQTVIWDRVQVQGYVVVDNRVDVDQFVNINVTLIYDYDNSPVIDGTVTVNGLSALHQGGGIWLFTDSKSTVQLATYDLTACSGNAHGITAVDQNLQTLNVIWDQVQVQAYGVSDSRVGLNENVDINVTLIYAYDSAFVTTGTVTINGLSATHQGSGVWSTTDSEPTVMANLYNTIACSGNTFGITNVDQNSQSTTVIWDQLVITIGVDDSSLLNGVQANFTLAVIFDYDDAACTTYQIVIQRNSTWWHSFTNTNKSSFIDTNFDTSYTYTVLVVTSESTYNVLTFSTNSQQVVWSAAPNAAPVNDAAPILTNPDDITFMYARYNYYIITSNVSDADGYTDIEYVELTLYDDSRSSPIWTVRYTVASDTFTIELGSAYILLKASSFALGSANDLDITWYIKIDWDHSDLTNVDTRQYVVDGVIGVEDFYESNWDVETRLEVTGLSIDDGSGTSDRGPLDGSINVSGTVVFLGSIDNYPLSNETDVWVSISEYGATTGPWSDFTLISGQFNLTAYADDEVGPDTLTIKVVEEAAGSGGTDLLAAVTQSTYIADRILVQTISSTDARANLGDAVTVDVELVYEHDFSSVTDGSVTVNGIVATHQGSGIWRISDTKASVQLVTYDSVTYSGGAHGLSEVNQNAMSQEVIWDQIVVQTTVADDTRINVGANVEIRVTLWLAYDSTFLGAGDTVTLNGTAMTWDGVNSWFDLTVSQASIGLWQYFVNSSSEATYGITAIDLNSQSVDVVWDQIVVQTTVVDDSRLNINTNAEIRVTLLLAYDSTYLGASDSVTLDGTAMTWDGVNSWFDLTVSQSSVGAWTYFVNASSDSTYGITSLDLNSQQIQVIWDEIVVQTTVADDTRVNMGDNAEIRVTLMLAYDSIYLGAADSVTLDGTSMTWDSVNSWFDLVVSQSSVGLWQYFVNTTSDGTYGITALNLNSQSVNVIWDRIVVQSTVVDDGRVDVSSDAEIRVTLLLEYDSTFLGAADSVILNGTAMTWDSVNSWFDLTVSQSSVGSLTYFVNSSLDSSYGISLLDLNGNSVSVIWDRMQVLSYSAGDTRVNIGDSVDIDISLIYDYDNSPVTDGTVTVNGITATHQGAGLWRFSDSEVVVVMNTYNLVVNVGNSYGLTIVDQNTQSQDVIWDRLVIVIGVDDASLLNGHQANFTLTVTYDYDDSICTTYQIVIDRNATWWHSFIDANTSLFVDTNTNATNSYNARIVAGESTYDITAFTTNTLLVTWSLAPNELPVNDSIPVLTNGDVIDYLYARYRYYVIITSVSDLDGYADLSYVELTLNSDDRLTQYWTVRYTVGTAIFSVEMGGSIVVIGAMSNATGIGDTLTITWCIKIGWDHPDIIDTDINQYVTDGPASDSDFYETNWNFETRLDYSIVPTLSNDRGDVNTTDLIGSGSVTYYTSSLNPLSNETDVWIVHDTTGTWSGEIITGSFSVSGIGSAATVRLNTYTFKIVVEGSGAGGTDLYYTTSLTDTFITDRIEIYEAGIVDGRIDINTDCEVWWRARYEYDSVEIQSGLTIDLNGSRTLVWDAGNLYWRWQETSISPGFAGFEIATASESTYGLTAWFNTTAAKQVIWDSLVISITDPVDQRIDVGANASGIFVSAVYAYDGAPYDGTLILNNTNFQYATPQIQGYTVISCSGDSYGITTIGINDETYCIWDRVLVVSINADEIYHDPNDDVVVTVELHYEYDGVPVMAGTFAIASYPLAHIGSGVWEVQVTIVTFQAIDFDALTTCNATLHGIDEYNMDSNMVTVYWDRLDFYLASVGDGRIDVGTSTTIEWSVRLESAGISITSGVAALMTGDIALAPSGGVYSATVTENVVGSITYSILSASLGEIDQFNQSVSDLTVVWDQVLLTSISATTLSLDTGTSTEIRVTLVYEFDSTPVIDGVVYLNDNGASIAMTYNSVAEYWSVSVTKNTAGDYVFTVDSVSGNAYGISVLDTDDLSVEIEWVGAPGFVIDTMTLVIIGGGAGIGILGAAIVASRRRKDGDVVELAPFEPGDLGAAEPAEVEIPDEPEVSESEAEEIEPTEPEVVEEIEIEAETFDEVDETEEIELPPLDEELAEPESKAVTEPEVEVVEEPTIDLEPEPEAEEAPDVVEEPSAEPEVEPEYDDVPEEFIEPEPVVDLTKLTKKELLDLIPDDIKETTSPSELKRLTKQELISLVESFKNLED